MPLKLLYTHIQIYLFITVVEYLVNLLFIYAIWLCLNKFIVTFHRNSSKVFVYKHFNQEKRLKLNVHVIKKIITCILQR